jgi:hypothetical protein
MASPPRIAVYLEVVDTRAFACSVDWPGWCRSGKTEDAALEALAAYAPRYKVVADRAGKRFAANAAGRLEVVERVAGSATTAFGAPGRVPELDKEPLRAAHARRMADLVAAAWAVLDDVAATAPEELRKGPRGGGRDRDKMVQHVLSAEGSYARSIGVKHPEPTLGDAAAITALRNDIVAVLRAARDGAPVGGKGWTPRYAARRIAWHVLDHAWEIEDRSES